MPTRQVAGPAIAVELASTHLTEIAPAEDTLAASANAPAPAGKTSVERHRIIWTRLFVVLVTAAAFTLGSRWDVSSLPGEAFSLLGIVLATTGCLGRLWSTLYITGRKSRELVTCGPYSICRNPLYFFSAVGLVGLGLTTATLVVPCGLAIAFAAYYRHVISGEEQRLHVRHGRLFDDYCVRTPRFWPNWTLYHEPARFEVYSKAIRRSFLDAACFLLVFGLIHAVCDLRDQGWLPTLFTSL
jgi:protein-S-isoprenylcysteine O-methyltransferase Ste14